MWWLPMGDVISSEFHDFFYDVLFCFGTVTWCGNCQQWDILLHFNNLHTSFYLVYFVLFCFVAITSVRFYFISTTFTQAFFFSHNFLFLSHKFFVLGLVWFGFVVTHQIHHSAEVVKVRLVTMISTCLYWRVWDCARSCNAINQSLLPWHCFPHSIDHMIIGSKKKRCTSYTSRATAFEMEC